MAEKVRCDVSGYIFSESNTRRCREPAVVKRYGTGGVAHVSVWVCNRCRHAVHYPMHGGLGCELERNP